jgi:hypothetical protein
MRYLLELETNRPFEKWDQAAGYAPDNVDFDAFRDLLLSAFAD